jgi:hypothetical protein
MQDFAVATAEAYQGFIDKPVMEAKHLNRPPFLFVLQIFIEVSKKTGFGKGLLTADEMTKDHYNTDAQLKVLTLKKINALVKRIESDDPYELTVENVIRGTDCDKTNKFLQALAKAAKKGVNTDDMVAKINDKVAAVASKKQDGGNPSAATMPTKEPKEAAPQRGGHEREVAEMTRGAKIEGAKGQEGDQEDTGKIRMGTLNRGGRHDTRKDDKKTQEVADQAAQGAITVDSIKEYIQNISQSINPMGKIIQFIDDDIESMKREYDNWARIYSGAKEQLEDKEKAIEAELQPYKDKIVAKEEQIREKKGQIDSLKSKILRNNLKVKKLMGDIIGTN